MDNLISRQAAIDALGEQPDGGDWTDEWECGCRSQWEWDKEAIENVPAAQPQRMRGRWDFIGNNQFRCTACKHIFAADWLEEWRIYTYEHAFPNFCPACGADMRGTE